MCVVGFGLGAIAFVLTAGNSNEWRYWAVACLAGVAYAFAAFLEFAGNHLTDGTLDKEQA